MTARELTVASAERRYVALTALRWFPLGISIPVTVLLASSRGLSAADIGAVFAVHSVVALTLELPTGGLADAIGARPVLVLSALLQIAGLLTLAIAHNLLAFGAAFALVGAGRALDSGPLEAWYVDAVHLHDDGADVTAGLARAAVANSAGLALGAVVGGLAPALAAGHSASSDALVLPFLLAAAIDVVYLVAVVALVVPLGPTNDTPHVASAPAAVLTVPSIVRDTVRLAARDRVLRQLLTLAFLVGTVLSTLELIGPLRFAELTGSRTEGTAVFGVVMAASFTAAALGAALATSARRAARGSLARTSAVLFAICVLAVSGIALTSALLMTGLAYAVFYLANAAAWPLRQQLMHSRVQAAQRSTSVSALSFALMIGVVAGSLLVPRLAEATSLSVAFWAAAAPLLLAGLLSLRLPSASDATTEHGQTSDDIAPDAAQPATQ